MGVKKLTKDDIYDMFEGFLKEKFGEDFEEVLKTNRKYVNEMMMEKIKTNQEKAKGKGEKAARWLRALAAGKGDPERAARYVKNQWDDEAFAKELLESEFEDGGVLVPDEYVNEIIDLLRSTTVVRSLGAQQIPMSGSLSMPKLKQGATAQYVGEAEQANSSQPKFGSLQLSDKKLKTLVPVSNDLLRNAAPNVDQIVRDDLVNAMSGREDIAFIRGEGSENVPKGMYYWVSDQNKFIRFDDEGSITLDAVTRTLMQAMLNLEGKDVPMTRCGWVLTPRSSYYLMSVRDGNGNYAFKDEMQGGTLLGYPFETTTQIPNNLDASGDGDGDESEIYFADFAQLIIGENTDLIIDVSTEGAFYDGEQMRSAFAEDLTLMRAIAKHDFGSRHDEAISVIEGVDWKFNV